MSDTVIYIADTAFISMLVSAVESFPSKYEGRRKARNSYAEGEVFGLLFGQKTVRGEQQVYNISIATPMQVLMDKKDHCVSPSERHFDKIKSIIEPFPMYQYLGTFHSHPFKKDEYKGPASARCSGPDRDLALNDAEFIGEDLIEMILALTYLTRTMNTGPELNWNYVQNYCGNYKYTLAGYVTNRSENAVKEVNNLICPFASSISNYDFRS